MAASNESGTGDSTNASNKEPDDRLKKLYPAVNEEETPLPRSWSAKDKINYLGLSQNNLRVHYKGITLFWFWRPTSWSQQSWPFCVLSFFCLMIWFRSFCNVSDSEICFYYNMYRLCESGCPNYRFLCLSDESADNSAITIFPCKELSFSVVAHRFFRGDHY